MSNQYDKVIVSKDKLTAIAENIRTQTKTTDLVTLDEMATMKLGTDTSNATATSDDILLGKTAYANDTELVGTIETYDGSNDGAIKVYEYDMLQKLVEAKGNCDYLFNSYKGDNLDFITHLDTSNATSGNLCFGLCNNLTKLIFFDTSNFNSFMSFANGCYKITEFPPYDTSKCSNFNSTFVNCYKLKKVKLNTDSMTTNSNTFNNCYEIETIDLSYLPHYSYNDLNLTNSCFKNCYSLKRLIIRNTNGSPQYINSTYFENCYHLTGTVNSTYNPNGDKDCYIYVPDDVVDKFKSYTWWSGYGDQIKPLSELVEE